MDIAADAVLVALGLAAVYAVGRRVLATLICGVIAWKVNGG